MSLSPEINLSLHAKQGVALQSQANEILYGGAAGGGKSHLMRVAAVLWAAGIPGLQVYIFRRIRDDLVKNHMEGPKGFRAMLAPWVLCGFVKIVDDEIRFWNGSRIYLCHCKDEKDIYKYQGAEIHVLLIDELTHFTETMYRFLRGRVRMVGINLTQQFAGLFPRIMCGANPGNIGHQWVKTGWIDNAQPFEVRQMPASEGGRKRQFIPARLEDNPSILEDDPDYEDRLEGLGSKALVEAMRWGNWDVVEGAFFDCWDNNRHVVRPFQIPQSWLRFASMDWGSASPFSVGWWSVVSDPIVVESGTPGKSIRLPRGCLVRYREWYGAASPNVGLKLKNDEVALGIKEREKGETITYRVLDPACFAQNGGPSIAEEYGAKGIHFNKADNTRVSGVGPISGWAQVRSRLIGDGDGNPMMVFFSTCTDSIRTIPVLQHDKTKPEDLDTNMEDHAADDVRYGANSRPWVPNAKPVKRRHDLYDDEEDKQQSSWKTA